jgi:hypothetical protein
VKVLLTIEGGFAKTIFEGDKKVVTDFLEGFQYARKMNLESPEVIGVLKAMLTGLLVPYLLWGTAKVN